MRHFDEAAMVVFINDASSPMGVAIAQRFDREGAVVILASSSRERLNRLGAGLSASTIPIFAEGETESSLHAAMTDLPNGGQPIDVFINTSGITAAPEAVSHLPLCDFASAVKISSRTLLNTIRPIIPFIGYGSNSLIVNLALADGDGWYGEPGTRGLTQIMLSNVMRILSGALVEKGIHATSIVVGCDKPFSSLSDVERSDAKGGRALTLADIAEAVYWIATQPPRRHIPYIELLPTDLPIAAMPRLR